MEKRRKVVQADTRSVNVEDDYALDFWAREFNGIKNKVKSGGAGCRNFCAWCQT